MSDPFAILLRNHQAGGRAAVDLFARAAKGQRKRPYAAQLEQLAAEAREDLDFNERVMRRLGVPPSPAQVAALRLGERAGRFKPNGQLVRRAPLSDVIELEGLIATVHIKVAGWQAAQVANRLDEGELAELERLMSRARTQAERLTELHRSAAAEALGQAGEPHLDVMRMASQERADLAELLATLSEEQWVAPSLCQDWRVRDVVAHTVSFDDVTLSSVLRTAVRGRLRLDGMNAVGVQDAAGLTTEELLARFRAHQTPGGLTKGFGGGIALVDGLIHHQDIRRALDLPRQIPAERLRYVLDFALRSPTLPGRRLSRGLRLVATDLDWSSGQGPEVRGPAESVLMALAGRPGVVDELSGDGLPQLRARLSR